MSVWWVIKILILLLLCGKVLFRFLGPGKLDLGWGDYSGQILVIIGFLATSIHYGILRKANINISHPTRLVARGLLFRYIRHPMYFGDILIGFGLSLLAGYWLWVAIAAIGALSLSLQARHEDYLLSTWFGDEFRQWQSETRLILPFLF
jgi:protein-S-isoprenylcysteine O-methyltransferase Ste14